MKQLQKLAIKYLIIGFGILILNYLAVLFTQLYLIRLLQITDLALYNKISFEIIKYLGNIIFGVFILFDTIKYTKNKLVISITGFLMPLFGVCFLLIEKYLIQKTCDNE
jgi:hypothetical protein